MRSRRAISAALLGLTCLVQPAWAKTEKPTAVAEEFFRLLAAKDYAQAAELLSSADQAAVAGLKSQMGSKGKNVNLEKLLADSFYLMQSADANTGMTRKNDAETIMPQRIAYFVPGQHYIVRNFAMVFTRETYELAHNNTGPVRDDPRKLWVDPTNVLSKVRDEAYFKQWWVWEGDRLTMPGLIWMIKEKNYWKIDLFSGSVPRRAFDGDLRLYFGREIFENEKGKKPAPGPKNNPPAKRP
ncbi:MAG: hypothetical protein HGA76_02030 [Candidatus Firestonebacteria bacterium]|nr:hypothetical protein [Candidatus Firestonebacteria bacterium]